MDVEHYGNIFTAIRLGLFGQSAHGRLSAEVGGFCKPLPARKGGGGVSAFLEHVRTLVADGQFKVTGHAFIELHKDGLTATEVAIGAATGVVVEEYPHYHAGPAILLLQRDGDEQPVHALWGMQNGAVAPVYLITAYRPDPERWMPDLVTRRSK